MYAANKIFGNICLKALRDTFFSNMLSVIRVGTGALNFLVGVVLNRRGKFKLLLLQGVSPNSCFRGTSLSSHKENPEEGSWSAYCNDFEKSE